MKIKTKVTATTFATIADNGSVSCPPYYFGRTERFVTDATGLTLGKPSVIARTRSAEPISSIPLPDQPLWAQAHAWVADRGEPVTLATVAALVKSGKVQLVAGTVKGNAETLVLPASWKSGQKLPKVCGVLPSTTYRHGRVEGYATKEDGGAVSGNAPVRASSLKVTIGDKAPAKAAPKAAPKAPAKAPAKAAPNAAPKATKATK